MSQMPLVFTWNGCQLVNRQCCLLFCIVSDLRVSGFLSLFILCDIVWQFIVIGKREKEFHGSPIRSTSPTIEPIDQ